jgi:hypothetical protein
LAEPTDQRLHLLELDHANAVRIVDSSLRTLGVVRGWAVTAWLGSVATAVELHRAWLAFVVLVPIAIFALHDGYLSWAYRAALRHARSVERVWQAAYDSASRGATDERVADDAESKLQAHRLGAIFDFPRFRRSEIPKLLPANGFWVVYVALAASAAGIGVALALTSS